ncbi:hypothetical protein HAHI6034_11175 [Hathewaya histolytica]|uniref:Uncharacterized protein n=1 Tax=Hathewaya histolytica TaxID=1498 RepID=A0A4U9RHU0_HATHI|nr:hypothetical protein [Hathewaya histolytica]VTQ88370.1 Uncharacterised protein [Hathewaya histolytica]
MDKKLTEIFELIRENEELIDIKILSEYIKYKLIEKKTTSNQ